MNSMHLLTSRRGGAQMGAGAPGFAPVFAAVRTLRVCLVLAAAFLFSAVAAVPGQAALTEAPMSPVGSAGTGELQFSGPTGIAVNRTTGDVYVADTGNNRIQRLSSDGTFISTFGWGVQDGSSALQTCTSGCQAGIAGDGGGQLSSPTGIAVDPASGDVYVEDAADTRIVHFDASGSFVGRFGDTGASPLQGSPTGVLASHLTFGAGGNLYVVDVNRIAVFDPAGNDQPSITPDSNYPGSIVSVTSVAADSAGLLYQTNPNVFTPGVYVIDSTGTLLHVIDPHSNLAGGSATAVAIDPADDHLFVADPTFGFQILEYDSAQNLLNDKMGTSGIGATTSMAYNATATLPGFDPGALYVADSQNNRIAVLVPRVAAPTVTNTRVANVRATTAQLRATINANRRDTTYYFEYGTTANYGATKPLPPGTDLGTDGANHVAKAPISGLQPATVYHYRVVAVNAEGTTRGPDRTLTTDRLAAQFQLPDHRGYEQATPVAKNNTEVVNPESTVGPVQSQGAPDGSGIAYYVAGSYSGGESAGRLSGFMSFKNGADWMTRGLDAVTAPELSPSYHVLGISKDLSHSVVFTTYQLSPDASPDLNNVYMRDNRTGKLTFIAALNTLFLASYPPVVGGSDDFARLYIQSDNALTSDAVAGLTNVYEWSSGDLRLVSKAPDGTPLNVRQQFQRELRTSGATQVSADGRRYYFESLSGPGAVSGPIYLREGGETVPVSVSHRAADPGAPADALMNAVSEDGSKAYFTSSQPLTEDAHSNRTELYEFDANSGELHALSAGFDLTGPSDDQVADGPVAVNPSGSTVYYSVSGASESKLLVVRNGITHVVRSYASPTGAPRTNSGAQTNRDGRYLTFSGPESDATSASQVYRYDADAEQVVCVSCRPSGEASSGGSHTTSNATGVTALPPFDARVVSNGGQVFFETSDALVPEDTNGQQDVYEWENGTQYLLSSGQGSHPSWLLDTSESGDDVYILTHDQLVGQDHDLVGDIYDVKVNGGIASQNPADPAAPCAEDACQGASPSPTALPTPASVTFTGPGVAGPLPGALRSPGKAIVKASRKVLKGSAFSVSVKAPGKGVITAAGSGLGSVRKSVSKAGTYKVTVRLTSRAKRSLKKQRQLKVKVRVSFTPAGGTASSTSVSVALKA